MAVFFREQPRDHEEVAEDADAAFGGLGMTRNRGDVSGPLAHRAEYVEFNRSTEGGCLLVCL